MGMIVAVTGKSGSGKSMVLSNLACALAQSERLVGCVNCDLRMPSLQHFFEGIEIPPVQSLGKLFSHFHPASMFVEYPKVRNLFITSTALEENCLAFEPPNKEMIQEFLNKTKAAFDVLLVECGEVLFNQLSARTVCNCDLLINIVSPTVQGLAWEKSNHELLTELRHSVRPFEILNADQGFVDHHEIIKRLGRDVDVELPYLKEVGRSDSVGVPIYIDASVALKAKRFVAGIEKLKHMVLEGGDST